MSKERPSRLRRWRRLLPQRPAPERPRLNITWPARPRPRAGAATGLPTLDDLLTTSTPPPPPGEPSEQSTADAAAAASPAPAAAASTPFGAPGRPINRAHPFYVGFVGALGVLVAYGLVRLLGQLSSIITLLVVSLFLALGLDPLVRWLQSRGAPRAAAVGVVFLGLIAVFTGFISTVIPPVVAQATELVSQLPHYVLDVQAAIERSETLTRVNQEYQVTERIQAELQKRLASGETVTALFGGIFGAGKALVSGIFSAFTVLVLTLYFLASLRGMQAAGYRLVPASRRDRVQLLGDEVTRRIGGYVIGQLTLASVNAVAVFIVLLILGIPYAAVLAFTVGVLGIIPLVGATIGGIVVVVVALFTSVSDAIVLGIYYLAYQQFENYVLAPRVMARTVSVPGAVALVAALAGGSLLGILGALIAIPIAAGILLIVQEVMMPQQDRS
jgi:predicted PurR-regulated permease PerM